MVAVEARCHKPCLAELYNKALRVSKPKIEESDDAIRDGIALQKAVEHIRNTSKSMVNVFKLSNLKSLYCEYLTSFGATTEYVKNVHSTRLKQRLMEIIPELEEFKKGRDVLLTYDYWTRAGRYVERKVVTTLSQLIWFNTIRNKRRKSETVSNIRQSKDQETPFPLYLGLLIHSKTRKKHNI